MSDHLSTFKTLKINHPDFAFIYKKGWDGYPVVVFERKQWVKPTPEATLDYEVRKTLVESLGGVMRQSYWEIAGPNAHFTKEDIKSMVASVNRDLQNYVIVNTWNGVGSLGFSVAIRRKRGK